MDQARTRRTSVVLARLSRGEWLHEAIGELARAERIDAGLVRGRGAVDHAELRAYDPEVHRYELEVEIEGPSELAVLQGSIALREGAPDVSLHAVVARPAEAGGMPIVAAGLLARARTVAVEIAIDVLEDGGLWRVEDPDTGLVR
jgi:predicted DNA-binding protein with PD1-like motif